MGVAEMRRSIDCWVQASRKLLKVGDVRRHELLVRRMLLHVGVAAGHALRRPSPRSATWGGNSRRKIYLRLAWATVLLLLLRRLLHLVTLGHPSLVLLLEVERSNQTIHSLRRGVPRVLVIVSE